MSWEDIVAGRSGYSSRSRNKKAATPVLPSPMPGGARQGAGRKKRVPGEETKPFPVNLAPSERARYERLAALWGCDLGEALRRAASEACAREGVALAGAALPGQGNT